MVLNNDFFSQTLGALPGASKISKITNGHPACISNFYNLSSTIVHLHQTCYHGNHNNYFPYEKYGALGKKKKFQNHDIKQSAVIGKIS